MTITWLPMSGCVHFADRHALLNKTKLLMGKNLIVRCQALSGEHPVWWIGLRPISPDPVIPAEAGIYLFRSLGVKTRWSPAKNSEDDRRRFCPDSDQRPSPFHLTGSVRRNTGFDNFILALPLIISNSPYPHYLSPQHSQQRYDKT